MRLSKKPPPWMRPLKGPLAGWTGCGSGPLCHTDEVARSVWGDCGRAHKYATAAFAYLWRRFGPSEWGGDDHKELAHWILGTPDKEVALSIYPSFSRIGLGYLCSPAVEDAGMKAYAAFVKKNEGGNIPMCGRIVDTIAEALNELTRPVYVRDVPANIFGEMTGWPKGLLAAPPSKYAGLGIEHGPLDKLLEDSR
jgi:hypothetical protein